GRGTRSAKDAARHCETICVLEPRSCEHCSRRIGSSSRGPLFSEECRGFRTVTRCRAAHDLIQSPLPRAALLLLRQLLIGGDQQARALQGKRDLVGLAVVVGQEHDAAKRGQIVLDRGQRVIQPMRDLLRLPALEIPLDRLHAMSLPWPNILLLSATGNDDPSARRRATSRTIVRVPQWSSLKAKSS